VSVRECEYVGLCVRECVRCECVKWTSVNVRECVSV
jgi:hypothetical protein